ncbi:MAG TPA: DPP IV N-terminal domain-containing protein, partial [Vicinamibacteria bacterium]
MARHMTSARPTRPARPTPAVFAGAALLFGLAGALPAQERREITVEWIFSDAGEEPTLLPRFEWTTSGELLLLDARRPKEERTFERLGPTGTRSRAVDARAALGGLKDLLGEPDAPDVLSWPPSLDRAGRRAVYVLAGDLFLLDLPASRFERLTRTPEAESVPRLSPDGRRLAFVRGNDLFVLDLLSRAESRLTSDGSDSVLNGALSWVYWEEVFDHRDAGYWWSEDGRAIAFLRTDESAVSLVGVPDFRPAVPRVIPQRYPKAGGPNPTVRLGIADVESGRTVWMDPEEAPYEYVVAVEWSPDSRRVAVQGVNRLQTRLDLYFVDRGSGKATRVLTETDAAWVNTQDLEFVEGGKGFLWTSDRDGYTHVYRYASDGTLLNQVTKGPWSVRGPRGFNSAP